MKQKTKQKNPSNIGRPSTVNSSSKESQRKLSIEAITNMLTDYIVRNISN